MDCRKAQQMLSAFHDGELAERDRAQVEAHLERCKECAAMLESIGRIDAAAGVPDPGTGYWESFNRRVEGRIAREEGVSQGRVLRHPNRGWVRQQLRYLVPAAVAAVLAVAVFRNIGPGPGAPARTEAPTSAESSRVPAPAEAPAPTAARDRQEPAAKSGRPRKAEGKAVTDRALRSRVIRETPAPAPTMGQPAAPAPRQAEGEAAGGGGANLAASERGMAKARISGDAAAPKGQTAGAMAPMAAGSAHPEAAATAKGGSGEAPQGGCPEAREMASKGRLTEAESAQRACLARDYSPAAQESGMVFLAELLDRQRRFAEADAVLAKAQERFPGSRPLEAYLQRRSRVQEGQAPVR
jgi:hypothetical protein